MSEFTLAGFAAFVTGMIAEVDLAKRHALEKGAQIIEDEAKRVIGTYDYDWPELAQSTQDERVSKGFEPNEPGLRTGEMRESIEHKVISSHEAQIGSDNDKLVWFELGTATQPPRPVLEGAAIAKEEEVAHELGHHVHQTLLKGKAV